MHREGAVHLLDALARDVEAEPGAADATGHLRVEAIELLEDALLLRRRDSEPLVAHLDAHAVALVGNANADTPAVRGVLERVLDEVHEYLAQQRLVAGQRRQLWRRVERQRNLRRLARIRRFEDARAERRHVDRLLLQAQ